MVGRLFFSTMMKRFPAELSDDALSFACYNKWHQTTTAFSQR